MNVIIGKVGLREFLRQAEEARTRTSTLGRTDAEKVYTLVAAQVREENVPRAQLALMWVSAHMPRTAEQVLAAARAHYGASAAA